MSIAPPVVFERRLRKDERRQDDIRTEYERDKGRVVHSAGFRRLQGKTQVMGVGEGDFHRTRLTHSIEVGQIGEGILLSLAKRYTHDTEISLWLPDRALVEMACYAHDLGHPPYGHGGERALQACMLGRGGFEGNAQSLRILSKLEKYWKYTGINPTRRTALSVLKYPVCYDKYEENRYRDRPPKCYYATEQGLVEWVLEPFSRGDRLILVRRDAKDRPCHRSLDASIMDCADDIAYAVHDLEDVVARGLVGRSELEQQLDTIFPQAKIGPSDKGVARDTFVSSFFDHGSHQRKEYVGRLVNLFVTEANIQQRQEFEHPLFRLRVGFSGDIAHLLESLKNVTRDLVVRRAAVQQLERRGQRVINAVYTELISAPESLIPTASWKDLDSSDTKERRVCDYVAGMTDPYAERIYHRLFTPGIGSSHDEL
jgi:dGTPase